MAEGRLGYCRPLTCEHIGGVLLAASPALLLPNGWAWLVCEPTQVTGVEEQVSKLEGQLREAKTATDKLQKEYNLNCERVQKLHQELQAQVRDRGLTKGTGLQLLLTCY